MVEITVFLYNKLCLFHCCHHISAIVKDLDSDNALIIDTRFQNNAELTDHIGARFGTPDEDFCCIGVVTLHSRRNFAAFHIENQLFCENDYHFCRNNCADLINFMLDYFFPESTYEYQSCSAYQILCCLFCIATLALKCFPAAPSYISTPQDVFNRAKSLASKPEVEIELADQLYVSLSGSDDKAPPSIHNNP